MEGSKHYTQKLQNIFKQLIKDDNKWGIIKINEKLTRNDKMTIRISRGVKK
jgi:hypothetical protein